MACYMLESGVQCTLNGIYFVLIANCHNHDNLVKPRAVEVGAILQYGNGQVLNMYFNVYSLNQYFLNNVMLKPIQNKNDDAFVSIIGTIE